MHRIRLAGAVSVGCIAVLHLTISHSDCAAAPADPVTFTKDVAPILYLQCATCHRPGEVAPFSLLTYQEVRKHATEIAEQTVMRAMPPWKAEPGFGDFIGARRLSEQQIATIQSWVKAGKPEGNASDLPPEPKFPEGWQLGQPDLVVKMSEPYTLQSEGRDAYRWFVLPLHLEQDQYVTAIEFRPSNRKIVHHSLFFLDTSGKARELDEQDPGPGFTHFGGPGFAPSGSLGGWAPGYTPRFLPKGVGRLVKKGSDLVLQEHFHPDGKIEAEQSTVGLYLAKSPPEKLLVSYMKGAFRIDIAPGDKDYKIENSFTVPADVQLEGIIPHAHLLCKSIKVTATLPGGVEKPLIWVKDWDWDWQDQYHYVEPLKIPKGTKVRMQFAYDNSADNIKNPSSPPARVHWGEQTKDEMALVFFQILVNNGPDRDAMAARLRGGGARAGAGAAAVRRWLQGLASAKDESPATQPAATP